ncbi:hypothetical protein EDD18DRAFT_486042 [Armillaria luteobubalina]|uniref:F-box domain-containing protein n=1 Tax=Armillaria luteobubalina TaxID=153913 RepID=A0AA39QLX7_9AGAR|nr:hypothetical protein EDD18DRAFT_486042 [Armillaria luteobubalina]
MPLLELPNDILISILQELELPGLSDLSRTCKALEALVNNFGWADYRRRHPRPSHSLACAQALWTSKFHVRYDTLADRSWKRSRCRTDFVARPLARPWKGKLQPVLAINNSRLVVACGTTIYCYIFIALASDEVSSVEFERAVVLNSCSGQRRDITAVTFIDGLKETLLVGFQNGEIEEVVFEDDTVKFFSRDLSNLHVGGVVEHLSYDNNMLLSLSSDGLAALTNLSVSPCTSSGVELQKRSWVSHLCMQSSTPYAAYGTSSVTPLAIHSITNGGLTQTPTVVLGMKGYTSTTTPSSAVYGICRAPLAAPWGSSPEIIVSGWYDGQVRCYDLRSALRGPSVSGSHSPLLPVLYLSDPLQYEPIYSVSCGGGSSSHVAAGSARHSVVSFWDIRSPAKGWSVHAPGNDSSPVYNIILESSRLFGATQSRPFVFDFGPGVSSRTYPHIPRPERDNLKKGRNFGYYVTQYIHRPSA